MSEAPLVFRVAGYREDVDVVASEQGVVLPLLAQQLRPRREEVLLPREEALGAPLFVRGARVPGTQRAVPRALRV